MGYSPWGRKELDITERLTLSHFMAQVMFPQQGRPDGYLESCDQDNHF